MKTTVLIILGMLLLTGFAAADNSAPQPQSTFDRYNFFEITIIVLVLIVLSELLIKNKLLVRYIWNVALAISFIAAAVTAILYFFRLPFHGSVVAIHIKLGLVMVWVGLYHAFKHITYYTKTRPWRK